MTAWTRLLTVGIWEQRACHGLYATKATRLNPVFRSVAPQTRSVTVRGVVSWGVIWLASSSRQISPESAPTWSPDQTSGDPRWSRLARLFRGILVDAGL